MGNLPSISGCRVQRLTLQDAHLLQDLWERCTAFHELQEGEPTRGTAGEEDIAALPPGKVAEDKFALGLARGERLCGYIDLVRDYPTPGEWSLGMLLLDPRERSRGLGTRVYSAAAAWAAAWGARNILIGVLEQNSRAGRFWERQGFREVGQQEFVAGSGHASRIRVMRHELRPLPATPECG